MDKKTRIPDATIERVAYYLRPLEEMLERGVQVVSSEKLAELCKVNPAQVRKDLSFFGEFGVRGVGYNVLDLLSEIKKILASDREWRMCITGLDNMGMALVQHKDFLRRGYRFVAAFDPNPQKVGEILPSGLVIQSLNQIGIVTAELEIEIGVISTSSSRAQDIAELYFEAGIMAILNFSPTHLKTPECCLVQNVDFTLNLDHLAFQLGKVNNR